MRFVLSCLLMSSVLGTTLGAEVHHSVARKWNDVLLEAIRGDFARPTVHARNLFHTSIALYDAWAAYDERARPFMLGQTRGNFFCEFDGVDLPGDVSAAREEAMSFAAYRLLIHRFRISPGMVESRARFDSLFTELGYDPSVNSLDYTTGSPAALGNYLGQCLIEFGLQDGANEEGDYESLMYSPVNPPLVPLLSGNPDLADPNRWQPLTLRIFIDQSGNVRPGNTPAFQSPEWGTVTAFALSESDLSIYTRDGSEYWVYHDPGPPPYLDTTQAGEISEEYKWGFVLVSIWASQLDPLDEVMRDISPATIGNVPGFPATIPGYREFYDLLNGGDASQGYEVNPKTGLPYVPQLVPRGDYARVLAEFWADGPDSETPPGHWFTILNYVNDHPLIEKRFKGVGPVLSDLEWDAKAYLVLGGAVHDAAVTAWGIKGWYDYIRPISAIRHMADAGQSTDPELPRFSLSGIPLVEGYIELVKEGDPLAGEDGEQVQKIKLYTWRGPGDISDPDTDVAGVGWILAEDWWPYQRPSFVTPPFAGYISGHSTFSRAAAEVLTLLTGDPFFPGGLGEFHAPANEFLVFEDGPSVDVTLQWAAYRDASDQTSLSRIWGGIHPPADDIPGRLIGEKIGIAAFHFAEEFFGVGAEEPSDGVSLTPDAGTGTWSMDLDVSTGDQGIRELSSNSSGREFTIELINHQEVSPALGGSFTIQFDPDAVSPVVASIQGIASQLGQPGIDGGEIRFTLAGLTGVTVEQGYIGQIDFRVVDGFEGDTEITLVKAAIGNAVSFENVESEPGNSVVIHISVSAGPNPDFDGDGVIGFRDFILFAQKFGTEVGEEAYDSQFDLDSGGDVGFRDFILFAQVYGKAASEFVAP